MAYFVVDDRWDEHPKLADLPDAAVALWFAGLAYCNRNLTDGLIPASVAHYKLRGPSEAAASALVAARLWEPTDAGYQVHDYLQWQKSKAQILALVEARRAAGATGAQARWQADGKPDGKCHGKPMASAMANGMANRWQTDGTITNTITNTTTTSKDTPIGDQAAPDAPACVPPDGDDPPTRPRPTDPPGFTAFWAAYPRKIGKGAARAWWLKHRPPKALLATMLDAIERQRTCEAWTREGGAYIPHPATWLRQERWEDEPTLTDTHEADEPHEPPEDYQARMRQRARDICEVFRSRYAQWPSVEDIEHRDEWMTRSDWHAYTPRPGEPYDVDGMVRS